MSDHFGKSTEIKAGGKTYVLARLTVAVAGELVRWATSQLPHPLDAFKQRLEGLPLEFQKELFNDARESAKTWGTMANPDVQRVVNSPDGIVKTFELLLKPHHPQVTESEIQDVLSAIIEEHGADYVSEKLSEAAGKMPTTEEKKTKRRRTRS